MKNLLLITHGPARGASAALDHEECGIGRDPSNRLFIPNSCMSTRHCVVRHENGMFKLVDLESKNGTLVNGAPVHEHALQDGDRISIGDSTLTFLCLPDIALDCVQLVSDLRTGGSARLRPEETYYLNPSTAAALPRSARRERDLHLLLNLAIKAAAIRDVDSLLWQVLGTVFQGIPARRGAILLANPKSSRFHAAVTWDRKAGPMKPIQVSREITQQVRDQGVGVLTRDPPSANKRTYPASNNSVMCVPLVASREVLGIIYLDTPHPSTRFDEQHLELLTGIAKFAALGLNSLSCVETVITENRKLKDILDGFSQRQVSKGDNT